MVFLLSFGGFGVVTDGFANVVGLYGLRGFEVGDGAGDFSGAHVASARQIETGACFI